MNKNIWKQLIAVFVIVIAFNYLYMSMSPQTPQRADISYSRFKSELQKENIEKITVQGTEIRGSFKEPVTISKAEGEVEQEHENFRTHLPTFHDENLMAELEAKNVEITTLPEEEQSAWVTALLYLLPWVLIIGIWVYIMRKMRARMGGGGMMGNFSKSGAKLYSREKPSVTFDNVAGLEEAKQDLMEVVQYLRDPEPFSRLGGKVPRGLILVGPPGTGKTLMARAVAGESGVPFFSISASQFIEMFVGVGASRVRDLFANAKKQAPSIIFIDELDAVGRSRGAGLGGGNDEREQTLNQLLSELDGFEEHTDVIVMAATNRPDVLDQALLRPGRFDRQVTIGLPDWRARRDILKVHVRHMPLEEDVDLEEIAKGTPGMCGADLESLVNEAAIIAGRENRDKVNKEDMEKAKDKIIMGAERQIYLSEEERKLTAYHEAGHALVARFSPEADPIHKVTIIPRGRALGATQQLPEDDRYHYRRSYLTDRLAVSMGGRVSEKLVFGDYSTGAQNDLRISTELAEKMVCQWGMSDKIGPVRFDRGEEHPFLGRKIATEKSFSERMAWNIDREIEKLVREGEESARKIVEGRRSLLDRLAEALLEDEVLEGERLKAIFEEEPEESENKAAESSKEKQEKDRKESADKED